MNFYRILIPAFSVVFLLSVRPAVSQDAVEDISSKPEQSDQSQPSGKQKRGSKPEQSGKSIQELMTPDEFKAAGLDKLSEDELEHLDAWLQGYRATTEKKASAQAEEKASEEIKKATEQASKRAPKVLVNRVVSRVDGTFSGLTGRTVIKLEDGTVWKQANIDDRYHPQVTDHPLVSVSHSPFGYKMRIEGTPEFYVNPVRSE